MNVKNISYVRVPENKIDLLVDTIGELLILESLQKENIKNTEFNNQSNSEKLYTNIERMERITKDLQNISMSLRMVSLKQTFQKVLRTGRDTLKELNKTIEFQVSGEETEIDRSIVEKIQDPLMHLIRNAISHGIENSSERIQKGKNAAGKINLKAYNKRGNVYIEISDDGQGMNIKNIYEKALEKNLISSEHIYSESEIINLIFLPGFSTADDINNISGRGVGMNVVESEMKKIGGKVEVKNYQGNGTTFILKIPINLATINGTIVSITGMKYILPTLNIKKIFKPIKNQWIKIKGKTKMIKVHENVIKLIPLNEILGFDMTNFECDNSIVILLEYEGKHNALIVDNVYGKQEIVIKPLDQEFHDLTFLSGATILGDGKVSLILDVDSLFNYNELN